MDTLKYKKKTRALLIVWLATYGIFNIASNVYYLYQKTVVGYNPLVLLSGYQIFSLIIMLVYFLPMLIAAYHYSKKANMPRVRTVTGIVLGLLGLWLLMMIVCTIWAIFSSNAY